MAVDWKREAWRVALFAAGASALVWIVRKIEAAGPIVSSILLRGVGK